MEDHAGDIWVGTYDGGIGWLHDGKWVVFNQSSGLYDNGAFQILEDGQERFWISSNRGIYRVSGDNWSTWRMDMQRGSTLSPMEGRTAC